MRHRPDPKDDMLSLQLMELETVRPAMAGSEQQVFFPFLGEDLELETSLTPAAAESDFLVDAANLPPGSSLILLVDSDSKDFH